MSNWLGWAGVALLLFAWLLEVTKYEKYFFAFNAIASTMLTIHAFLIRDYPFIVVNGFIACIAFFKAVHHKKVKGKKKKGNDKK